MRARHIFAEPGGEHRRIGQGVGDELLDVVGEITNTAPPGGSSSVSGSRTMMPSSDAVVAPSADGGLQSRGDGARPRGVHP